MRAFVAALAIVLSIAAPLRAADVEQRAVEQAASAIFEPVAAEYDIPGLVVGVAIADRTYFYSYGLAEIQRETPVTPDTIFELGSISKLFTVALSALAEQRELLSLDARTESVWPRLEDTRFGAITLSDLAAHATGGLPLQVPDHLENESALIDYLANWSPASDTEKLRSYSNISIGLLGLAAGNAFDSSLQTAFERQLVPGLGLHSTFISVPATHTGAYAMGYTRDGKRPIRVKPGLLAAEAYGVKSTARDMTRLLQAHLGTIPVNPEISAALVRTRQADFHTRYYSQAMIWEGYAWPLDHAVLRAGNATEFILKSQGMSRHDRAELSGDTFMNKTGSTNGFGAYVALVPSKRIGVVVLANRPYPNPVRAEATARLIEHLLDGMGRFHSSESGNG